MAILYVVSTPIGNLSDLSARAAQVLGRVRHVLAEDTRRTRVLLDHLGVHPPTHSLHAHNEAGRVGRVLGWLDEGHDVALVSDAGTPLVSDPGARLVAAVTAAGYAVVPVPGPSAVLAALVVSGLPAERFTFLGFVPRKGRDRADLLERAARAEETLILFESPERLTRLLADLAGCCGPERRVAVAREVTKIHEEFLRGTLAEALTYYEAHRPRGEVTVILAGAPCDALAGGADAAKEMATALLAGGKRASEVSREVSRRLHVPKNTAYRIVHALLAAPEEKAE